MANHRVENFTMKMIKSHFGIDVEPHSKTYLNLADECPMCIANTNTGNSEEKEQVQHVLTEDEKRDERKRIAKRERCQREAERILFFYRPDQETRVTLHDVHFVRHTKGEPPTVCRTSFYGKVKSVYAKVREIDGQPKTSASVTVSLLPRKDLSFGRVASVQATSGLSLSKNKKGFCTVVLNETHLTRKSQLVALGTRCKPGKCYPTEEEEQEEEAEDEASEMTGETAATEEEPLADHKKSKSRKRHPKCSWHMLDEVIELGTPQYQ